jgi:tRNA A37 methylthiotransferase MiaB
LATLYLNDLADVLRDAVDSRFEFVRYGESLAGSQATFEPLAAALTAPPTLMDEKLQALTLVAIEKHQPTLVLLSVPFPGAVYAAFRIAQCIKQHHPRIHIAMGGGFVNTELRELTEPRVFDYVDFVTLDSGERPLLALLEHLEGNRSASRLVRTFIRKSSEDTASDSNAQLGQRVQLINWSEPDVPFEEVGTATWDGLPLQDYLSLLDMLNPMHRLWSDGRWNKLTVAHGCYWKKCSFCDVSLDYISRYETASASLLVDRIEQIVKETGQTGFHFVDEAAPPKALKALAEELIRRNVHISWWGNIRFEKTFTPELAELLAESGCIAMSGGLEVASDRLLKLMKKGVTVEQVAQVTKGFSEAGILVHAYLMYGFPTQTVQDTVDALEYVRQLFEQGCIQSGFFHRFACTVHSPVGLSPKEYGIELIPLPPVSFGKNDIGFIDGTGVDHDLLGLGLKKAIYNFMHGIGLDQDVRTWFQDALIEHAGGKSPAFKIPKSTASRNKISLALQR